MKVDLSREEIEDLLMQLDQCHSQGWLNAGDPVLSAYEKLQQAIDKDEDRNER